MSYPQLPNNFSQQVIHRFRTFSRRFLKETQYLCGFRVLFSDTEQFLAGQNNFSQVAIFDIKPANAR